MNLLWCNMAAWAVVILYALWKAHLTRADSRRLALRRRVAYMLWVMVERADEVRSPSGHWRLTARSS